MGIPVCECRNDSGGGVAGQNSRHNLLSRVKNIAFDAKPSAAIRHVFGIVNLIILQTNRRINFDKNAVGWFEIL